MFGGQVTSADLAPLAISLRVMEKATRSIGTLSGNLTPCFPERNMHQLDDVSAEIREREQCEDRIRRVIIACIGTGTRSQADAVRDHDADGASEILGRLGLR